MTDIPIPEETLVRWRDEVRYDYPLVCDEIDTYLLDKDNRNIGLAWDDEYYTPVTTRYADGTVTVTWPIDAPPVSRIAREVFLELVRMAYGDKVRIVEASAS